MKDKIYNTPGFYETDGDGLIYKSKNAIYHLLEGKCSNGLTSDIVFIMKLESDFSLTFVNYCYGAFNERNGIAEYIKDYEEKHITNYQNIRGLFYEIAEKYGQDEKETSSIYQFLSRFTHHNTNNEIIDILEKARGIYKNGK